MKNDQIVLELDCTTPDVQVALTLDGASEQGTWTLGPLIDLVGAAASGSANGPVHFALHVVSLPYAHEADALRLTLQNETGAFSVVYRLRSRPGDWFPCLDGTIHREVQATPPVCLHGYAVPRQVCEPFGDCFGRSPSTNAAGDVAADAEITTDRLIVDLSTPDSARDECSQYVLHPRFLATALQAATRALLNVDEHAVAIPIRQIEIVSLLVRGAVPTTLMLQLVDSGGPTVASASFFDQSGRLVAHLGGIASQVLAAPSRRHLTLQDLLALADDSLGRRVEISEHLLATGASSLDLVRFSNAIFEASGVSVPLGTMLAHPTLEEIFHLVANERQRPQANLTGLLADVMDSEPLSTDRLQPLTSLQRAIWLASCQPGAASSYIEAVSFRLRGRLDTASLQTSWLRLVRTHESCRSSVTQEGGSFYQLALPSERAALQMHELARTVPLSGQEVAIGDWLHLQTSLPFEAHEPLVRAVLLRVTADEHVLLFVGHHAMCDGKSLRERLLPDLSAEYAGRAGKQAKHVLQARHLAQLETMPQFAAEAERASEQLRRELADAPLVTEFPAADPNNAPFSYRGRCHRFQVPPATRAAMREVAQREKRSMFVLALAVFRAALYRWAQLDDVLVGIPIAQTWSPSFETAAGCFVDLAPLRLRLEGSARVRDLIGTVQASVVGAIERQHAASLQLAVAPALEGRRLPRVSVGFVYEASTTNLELRGLEIERLELDPSHVKLELLLRIEDAGDSLLGCFEYSSDLFQPSTIEHFTRRYLGLLEHLGACIDVPVCSLPWLSADERKRSLEQSQGARVSRVRFAHDYIADAIASGPDNVAIVDGVHQLTYYQLDLLANALAQRLVALVERGRLVGIYLETGLHSVVGTLGSMRACACFVPIEPNLPEARIRNLLDVANIEVVITLRKNASDPALRGRRLVFIDELAPTRHVPEVVVADCDLVYGIFTSGSTGTPKLALAAQAGVANKVLAQLDMFKLAPGTRVLQFASPAFDAALSELVLALASGSTLVTAEETARYDGSALFALMRRERIQAAMLTPSVVSMLPRESLDDLELLLVVGERCAKDLVDYWAIGRRMFNLYGPAETSVWATGEHCMPGTGAPGIGRPIANVHAYILDRDQNLLPEGQAGEICIGGAAVGPGYWNAPELTSSRFLADPYANDTAARLYRTGDRGKYLPDGRIMFLGRQDEQVKLRGRRIELGEVEAALREHAGVDDAVVLIHSPETPAARLVAYVVESGGPARTEHALREALRPHLPGHVVPSRIMTLGEWPRLPSGKIDRRALSARAIEPSAIAFDVPRTALEAAVANAMAAVLRVDVSNIGRESDFLALGGHSLSAVSLAEELAKVANATIPLTELLASPSVREIAARLETSAEMPVRISVAEAQVLAADSVLPQWPTPKTAAREPWQTVLLTGATGSLGKHLLAALLRNTHASVVCLVRGTCESDAQHRLLRELGRLEGGGPLDRNRVRVVSAHLERPMLGLAPATHAWLSAEVDAIFHVAAAVNFVLPYSRLRGVNVQGTRSLVELALRVRRKEFHYVSSLSALFPRVGQRDQILKEVSGPEPSLLTMSYGRTKAVSERLLSSAADRGLPVRIYRPSRVCPSAQARDPNSHDLLLSFLRGCVQMGRFPDIHCNDNLVPVDHAAALILDVALKRNLSERYFHIANPLSTPVGLFAEALCAAGNQLRVLPYESWCEELANSELAPLADFFRRDRVLEHGLPVIDTQNTRTALGALNCPQIDLRWLVENVPAWLEASASEQAA